MRIGSFRDLLRLHRQRNRDQPATSSSRARAEASPGKVVFWATVLPDEVVMPELFRYISGTDRPDERIALLTESDTKFGANIQNVL